jgi:mono/diheme cytochrome c family protein
MPTFQGLVSEEQVNALVAYIKSISAAKPGNAAKTSASTAAPGVQENAQPNGSQVQ